MDETLRSSRNKDFTQHPNSSTFHFGVVVSPERLHNSSKYCLCIFTILHRPSLFRYWLSTFTIPSIGEISRTYCNEDHQVMGSLDCLRRENAYLHEGSSRSIWVYCQDRYVHNISCCTSFNFNLNFCCIYQGQTNFQRLKKDLFCKYLAVKGCRKGHVRINSNHEVYNLLCADFLCYSKYGMVAGLRRQTLKRTTTVLLIYEIQSFTQSFASHGIKRSLLSHSKTTSFY